jgi:hypothetical protein
MDSSHSAGAERLRKTTTMRLSELLPNSLSAGEGRGEVIQSPTDPIDR